MKTAVLWRFSCFYYPLKYQFLEWCCFMSDIRKKSRFFTLSLFSFTGISSPFFRRKTAKKNVYKYLQYLPDLKIARKRRRYVVCGKCQSTIFSKVRYQKLETRVPLSRISSLRSEIGLSCVFFTFQSTNFSNRLAYKYAYVYAFFRLTFALWCDIIYCGTQR